MAKAKELKQVKMTDEIRAKLRGYSFVSGSIMLKYTPEVEGVDKQFIPTFRIKTLTISERENVQNTDLTTDTEEYYDELIRSHLVGWENMYDLSTEEQIAYVGGIDGCDKELFDKMNPELKVNILMNIIKLSR